MSKENTTQENLPLGQYVSVRSGRRVISGVLVEQDGRLVIKLGVKYVPVNREDILNG